MSGEREPWVAVKVGLPDNPKFIELPSDSARLGLIVMWTRLKVQRPSGMFRSTAVAREVLGRFGRFVPVFIGSGFLHAVPYRCDDPRCLIPDARDGALVAHSWHLYQREHAVRQADYRAGRGDTVSDAPSDVRSDSVSDIYSRARRSMSLSMSETVDDGGGVGEDGRADLEAFCLVTRRAPTPRQRKVLDGLLDTHDLTGPQWAADIILAHPDDPIGAVIAADKAWRAERIGHIAEGMAAERKRPTPRRRAVGLTGVNAELAALLRAQETAR